MSGIALEEIKIEVPNMGDSITEGSIAGIERKPGRVFYPLVSLPC